MAAPKHIYRRLCNDCSRIYSPIGKYQKYCPKCKKKRRDEVTLRLKKEILLSLKSD